ncbi:PREDICTED: uncharacterized protein LOC105149533 isoform X2 [Acromyrmex echinatior]|uniref:Uncharacterized protein n=2 Tax=Acromyrmex echinatior TaxID=103372 RepID=F4WVA0_ACREC|nr:PREDICTED: uncharacterized protein LOC105149533 isoform X2 [Acromyrmex echinatior]XP_011060319.1 PREDICTED: uncharacterized protein LOC105149533 isoform X2 [Acromyrmex echinatior]XP_011060320.1 PREDICTED: uncharacterized protein LOC105149533 isoform X2 [Acromyrmex echinatior]EGI61866.1 hypothetical protein G5I_09767 [Acromyrmex echinatior]
MFYLDGRDGTAAKYDSSSPNGEENFGWWLNDREIVLSKSHHVGGHRSLGSSMSILSCMDSDDSDSCSFARDVSLQEQESEISENIELISFTQNDLDIDLIERDARETSSPLAIAINSECNVKKECITPICYTPERLIRSQEYRILTPSPRCFTFSQARFTAENESREWKSRRCRKQLSLIDSKQIGTTQLKTLLNLPSTNVRTCAISSPISERRQWATDDFNASMKSNNDSSTDVDCGVRSMKTGDSSRSSYDRLNSTWDDCKGSATRPPSLEDTSGIHSYDWSLETQSDVQNTPICLCDELAIASKEHTANFANDRGTAINEVVSILEGLRSDPRKATVLLEEEDRFCSSTSSHDQLTRLALTIETDVEAPAVPDDPNNWIRHLRDRIERLQLANKEIHGDIRGLRTKFQCDEKKAINLSSDTTRLLEDVHDLRYFDDLVKLLEGELETISRRNWPFILGHSKPHEEMNLII